MAKVGRVAGATHRIIEKGVGKGQTGAKMTDAIRIQRLLNRIGYRIGEDGDFGPASQAALQHFQANWAGGDAAITIVASEVKKYKEGKGTVTKGPGGLPVQPYVTPDDPCLFALACAAGLLIELSSKKGQAAFNEVWPRIDGIQYRGYPAGNGAPHMYWGLDLQDYKGYAIMTGDSKCKGLTKSYQFPAPQEKLAMHCTSFATFVMSVWHQGDLSAPPYDAHQQWGGNGPHLPREYDGWDVLKVTRNDKPTSLLTSVEELTSVVTDPNRLYLVECASLGKGNFGEVKHFMAAYRNDLYEAKYNGTVSKRDLATRAKETLAGGRGFYVWGPSPSL
jgi:hypothetical protein